jgi:hypothetical protein
MVRQWRVFPYGQIIGAVVWAVMDKDRQGAAQKRQAAVRLHEARPKMNPQHKLELVHKRGARLVALFRARVKRI